MNKKLKEFRKIRALQEIPRSSRYGSLTNCSKFWYGIGHEHYRVMSDIVWKLASQDFECYTEVTLNNGKRMDIVAISPSGDLYNVEVLNSEKEDRYNEKLESYPIEFTMVQVFTKDFDINTWKL